MQNVEQITIKRKGFKRFEVLVVFCQKTIKHSSHSARLKVKTVDLNTNTDLCSTCSLKDNAEISEPLQRDENVS